jgi:hypothetical protein
MSQSTPNTIFALLALIIFISSNIAAHSSTTPVIASTVSKLKNINTSLSETTISIQVPVDQTHLVQEIFDALRIRLTTATSPQETQQIFNDTIIELERYSLLPKELSVAYAQRLVSHATMQQKITSYTHSQTTEGAIQNIFCSVAGNTTNTHVAKLAKRIALRMYYIIDFNTGNQPLRNLATGVYIIFNELSKINLLLLQQNGYHFGVCLYFGNYHYAAYPNWLSPAQGWISTNGIYGQQNITGSFWGQTMTSGWQPQVDWYMNYSWRGCLGFTGLLLYSGTDTVYFLGSALAVNIGPNRP